MAVTDLTNTKWLFDDDVSLYDVDNRFYITFTSNNNSYSNMTASHGEDYVSGISYGNTKVYDNYEWNNVAFKTIEITGGTDATNASLISWLTANATQITSGGSMYLGTSTISKMYLGQNEVSKVYLGQDLVYEKQASGGTISLRGVGHQSEQADSYYSYIKINEAPTTAQDYDYMVTGRGYVNSKTQTQITQPVVIEGASVVYLWCDYNANFTCQYKVDNGSYQNLTPFSSPTTLTLTNDIELTLTGWRD